MEPAETSQPTVTEQPQTKNTEPVQTTPRSGSNPKKLIVVLVLLLIVIAGGVTAFYFLKPNEGAKRDVVRKQHITQISEALENAKKASLNAAYYPSALTERTMVKTGFLQRIPKDPQDNSEYIYTATPENCTTQCTGYTLSACLEDKNDNSENTSEAINPCTTRSYIVNK